jgi:hypothetical protein
MSDDNPKGPASCFRRSGARTARPSSRDRSWSRGWRPGAAGGSGAVLQRQDVDRAVLLRGPDHPDGVSAQEGRAGGASRAPWRTGPPCRSRRAAPQDRLFQLRRARDAEPHGVSRAA